jgi:hypothetical protein
MKITCMRCNTVFDSKSEGKWHKTNTGHKDYIQEFDLPVVGGGTA